MLTKLGAGEILIVLIVVVLFVGPDKLPHFGRMLGRALGDFKRYMNNVTEELKDSSEELKSVYNEVDEIKKDVTRTLKSTGEDIMKDLDQTVNATPAPEKEEKQAEPEKEESQKKEKTAETEEDSQPSEHTD